MAADIFAGKNGLIAGPLPVVGYPTYSGDDKIIAYHTLESIGGTSHNTIHQIQLDSTLIMGYGNSTQYLVDATYPVWFVIGSRLTDIQDNSSADLPLTIELQQNYPNPFNPSTTIEFSLPRKGYTTLKIFNILGEEIETLISADLNPGIHRVQWYAKRYASDTYFCCLTQNNRMETRKLVLVK
jgi:hypothetical protein